MPMRMRRQKERTYEPSKFQNVRRIIITIEAKSSHGLWSSFVKDFQRWYPLQSAKEVAVNALIGIGVGAGLYSANARMGKCIPPLPEALKGKRSPLIWAIECLLVPVFEESFFRGHLKEEKQATRQESVSSTEKCKDMIVNSAIFSAAHALEIREGIKKNIVKMPFYMLAGCMLWQLANLTNNLWASTVAHGACNALTYPNRKKSLGSAILARKI